MSLTDQDTIAQAQKQMQKCALDLQKMANDVADAKVVKEFNSDRLKRALSVAVEEHIFKAGSVSGAEHLARAGKLYGTSLNDLSEQYKAALRVIEQHEALKVKFESARSILAVERQKLNL